MKILSLYLLFLFSDRLYAQSLNGYVFDEVTRKPIPGATVSAGSQISITTENGHFNLKDINLGTGIGSVISATKHIILATMLT